MLRIQHPFAIVFTIVAVAGILLATGCGSQEVSTDDAEYDPNELERTQFDPNDLQRTQRWAKHVADPMYMSIFAENPDNPTSLERAAQAVYNSISEFDGQEINWTFAVAHLSSSREHTEHGIPYTRYYVGLEEELGETISVRVPSFVRYKPHDGDSVTDSTEIVMSRDDYARLRQGSRIRVRGLLTIYNWKTRVGLVIRRAEAVEIIE